jgi:hypothetical protein
MLLRWPFEDETCSSKAVNVVFICVWCTLVGLVEYAAKKCVIEDFAVFVVSIGMIHAGATRLDGEMLAL